MKNASLAGLLLLLVLSSALPGWCHRRDFPFTVDWKQPVQGEKELESHSLYSARDRAFEQAVELEYGVTERFSASGYLVFTKPDDGSFKYTGWKGEARYQLTPYRTGKILAGLYGEYFGRRRDSDEVEGKVVLSRYATQGQDLSFNYVTEKEREAGENWENTWSLGYAVPLSRRDDNFWGRHSARGGAELIHDMSHHWWNGGPVVALSVADQCWLTAGVALPLSSGHDNRAEFRVITEFEWF